MRLRWLVLYGALALLPTTGVLGAPAVHSEQPQRWSADRAKEWYARQPWLVGSNYIPANAINQLEMWQPATFDPARIERELSWAEAIGMNTARVFLHNLLWEEDAPGFLGRIDVFLQIAARHHIKPIFVLFDSVWDPNPVPGPQHPPIPGVHNSGWVQSPGRERLRDVSRYPQLRSYVEEVVGAFSNDGRVLAWDVWNEPDNDDNVMSGSEHLDPREKQALVAKLLPQVFDWARAHNPKQPLTSGLWHDADWSTSADLNEIESAQLAQSDILSFHNYEWPEQLEARIHQLRRYGRPIVCTEYLARGYGSTFEGSLPVGKRYRIAMINWGLVDGKTQTRLPWDSWQRPYTLQEPPVWHHDIFHADGTPYRRAETDLIRALTAAPEEAVSPHPR